MAQLDSALLYITLTWLYFTLLHYIHYSTMALRDSTSLYINLPLLYFTILRST